MNWKVIRIVDMYVGIPLLQGLRILRSVTSLFPRPQSPAGEVRSILLIKFWGVGNLFMMLPAAEALRRRFPAATIDLFTMFTNRDAASAIGRYERVHGVDTRTLGGFIASTVRCLIRIRKKRYDLIIDFEQFARFSSVLCSLSPGRETIGFDTTDQRRHYLFTRTVEYDNAVHIVRSYLSLSVAAGAVFDADELLRSFRWTPAGEGPEPSVRDRLGVPPEQPLIVMHIGTSDNFKERRWPAVYYAALADLLTDRAGTVVVLTGLTEEAPLAARVLRSVCRKERVIDASGNLAFEDFLALLSESDLVVSSDTAPVHMASAMGVPVVGLYGPNTPRLYGPWRQSGLACTRALACSPCITNFNAKTHVCRHPDGRGACMIALLPEEVYQAIKAKYLDHPANVRTDPCIV